MTIVADGRIDTTFQQVTQEAVPGIEGPDIAILQHLAGLATENTLPLDLQRTRSLPYRIGIHPGYTGQLVLAPAAAMRLKQSKDFRNRLYAWYGHPHDRDLARQLRGALVSNLVADLALQCSIDRNLL